MKPIFYLLLCLFFCLSACKNSDNFMKDNVILQPSIKQDIETRFPGSEILNVYDFLTGTEINLKDKLGNNISLFYESDNSECMLTVTKFVSFENLPDEVKQSFYISPYGKRETDLFSNIECDEYKHLRRKMYKLEFYDTLGRHDNLYTLLMFNDDGFMFPVRHNTLNQSCWHKQLNTNEISFIENNYGNDIRSFNNDSGYNSYYVMDHGILKYIQFDEEWKSTTYSLPLETKLPVNVMIELQELQPGFNFVKLNKIETPYGEIYQFLDEKGDGYNIGNTIVSL